MFFIAFLLLGALSCVLLASAPGYPQESFVSQCLVVIVLTNLAVGASKLLQPKPVNWLTADVLFTVAFSTIHFGYFFYWVTGFFGTKKNLWDLGIISVPQSVCPGLAMYLIAINCFLAGYHILKNKRFFPKINEVEPTKSVAKRWGFLGQMLVRIGFGCYLTFVILVGPAVFFGTYSGTNNISFIGNIFYQIGQVVLVSGITVAVVAKQRVVKRSKRGLFSFQISAIDFMLIITTLVAIGMHGDRSTLLTIGVAFLIAYSEYVKPFRMLTLIATGAGVIFLLGLIMLYRSGRDVEYGFVDNINRAMVNMGTSAVCGFVAVEYADGNLSYGRRQILQLLGIMPFGRRLAGYPDNIDTNSSMYLTFLIQGRVGRGVAGSGTSAFADYYFDFGLIGTALLFFLIGLGTKLLQNKARCSTGILWQVAFVNLVSFLAICSRYSITGGLIRYVIYSTLYVGLLCYFTGTPFRDRSQEREMNRIIMQQKRR